MVGESRSYGVIVNDRPLLAGIHERSVAYLMLSRHFRHKIYDGPSLSLAVTIVTIREQWKNLKKKILLSISWRKSRKPYVINSRES